MDREDMCLRRLWVLIHHLPADGAFAAAVKDQKPKSRVTGVADLAAWFGRIRKS